MAWDKKRPYVAVDDDGNMVTGPVRTNLTNEEIDELWDGSGCIRKQSGVWCSMVPFKPREIELKLRRFVPNYRAVGGKFVWADSDGREYVMFDSDFNQMLSDGTFESTVRAVWSVRKCGYTYGIFIIGDAGR